MKKAQFNDEQRVRIPTELNKARVLEVTREYPLAPTLGEAAEL